MCIPKCRVTVDVAGEILSRHQRNLTMTGISQPTHNSPPPPPQARRSRSWRRPLVATAAGFAALIGLGSIAVVAAETTATTDQTAVSSAPGASPISHGVTATDCAFEATLTSGTQGVTAFDAFGPATSVESYRGIDMAIDRGGDEVAVGAMIEDSTFLELRAAASRESELVQLMMETIDEGDTFDHGHDTVVEFRGDHCELGSAFDEEAWVEDFFHSDAVVDIQSDDGECRFSSLFADSAKQDDFGFEDLNLGDFDLDLQFDDDGFNISLDTGDGTVGLKCLAID